MLTARLSFTSNSEMRAGSVEGRGGRGGGRRRPPPPPPAALNLAGIHRARILLI
jgi:hypothetical protein